MTHMAGSVHSPYVHGLRLKMLRINLRNIFIFPQARNVFTLDHCYRVHENCPIIVRCKMRGYIEMEIPCCWKSRAMLRRRVEVPTVAVLPFHRSEINPMISAFHLRHWICVRSHYRGLCSNLEEAWQWVSSLPWLPMVLVDHTF